MGSFGNRLEQLRKEKGLNKKEVSFLLGFTANVYGSYEREDRRPSIDTLMDLANLYNISLDYLISGKECFINEQLNNYIEIKKIMKSAGIDNPEILDSNKWELLSGNDIQEIENFFEWVVQKKLE